MTDERLSDIEKVVGSTWEAERKLRAELIAEVRRLRRVIAKELTENDELGCEYTYVNVLKRENGKLREQRNAYIKTASTMKEFGEAQVNELIASKDAEIENDVL